MVLDDFFLRDVEISLLDLLLTEISRMYPSRSIQGYRKLWVSLEKLDLEHSFNSLDSLRMKGILNVDEVKTLDRKQEGDLESVQEINTEVVSFDAKYLVFSWLVTVYDRSGKGIEVSDFNKLKREGNSFVFPIKIGNEDVHIRLVVEDTEENDYIRNSSGSLYVSFIGELPIDDRHYIHWYNPLSEISAAARFFSWINEQSKPIISKQYNFINIPSDLEKAQRESVVALVKQYVTQLGYERYNQPEYFRPESTDYFFPENTIRECFVYNSKKIFLVVEGDRIQLHSFDMGEKVLDKEFSYHTQKLQDWIDHKATKYRALTQKSKSTLSGELIKITPLLIGIVMSAFASLKLLWQVDFIKNFTSSKYWLVSDLILSGIAIVALFFFGILPQFTSWTFSWNRRIKRFANKNRKYYKS